MAERLIDAEAVERYPIRRDNYDKKNGSIDFINGVESVLEYVNNLPTIEAKPVVHAHWEIEYDDDDNIKKCYCSNCGVGCEPMNYCGSCGAQMDEGVKIPVISMEDVLKLAKEND